MSEEEVEEDVTWEEERRREREDVLPIEWLPEGPESVGLVDGSVWSQIAV